MMMFVLMAALLIAMVTLGVMRMVAGDVSEGFGGLEAVQAFNVAEAGAHFAIGQLQAAGSGTYAGETITITSGSATLGTATIQVNCIDTGSAPPCTGTYAAYRRIVSTSTLPMNGVTGGPTRTIVAIVQATSGSTPYGVCGTGSFPGYKTVKVSSEEGNVNTDLGSSYDISIGSTESSQFTIRADTASPQKYTGKAVAGGTITCGGYRGSGGCPVQVQGGTFPGTSPSPCAPATLPVFSTGGSALIVPCTGASIAAGSNKKSSISWTTIATPGQPTVTQVGATGVTSYSYQIVARDSTCNKQTQASPQKQITTGYASLSGLNYNHITWTAVAGASSYDVLSGGRLLGNTTALSMNDTGQATTSYNTCATYTDLTINTSGTPSVLEVTGTFTMPSCARVIIAGTGTVEVRLGQSTGLTLTAGPSSRFGVLSTDTQSTPAPVPANRLTVNVNSNAYGASPSNAAVDFQSNDIVAGTFNVPNGEMAIDGGGSGNGTFYGAISAGIIYIGFSFYSDTTGTSGSTWTNFTNLRSWKDQ